MLISTPTLHNVFKVGYRSDLPHAQLHGIHGWGKIPVMKMVTMISRESEPFLLSQLDIG
jgi:hypothetical protein